MTLRGKAGIRYTALACLSCLAAALLAGCGGGASVPGGASGGGGPLPPPPPPWKLMIYESGKASPAAEGTLTLGRDGYRLVLDGDNAEEIVVRADSISREGKLLSLPVSRSQRETFPEADLKRALSDIAQAQPTSLRSADLKHTYVLQPETQSQQPGPAVTPDPEKGPGAEAPEQR